MVGIKVNQNTFAPQAGVFADAALLDNFLFQQIAHDFRNRCFSDASNLGYLGARKGGVLTDDVEDYGGIHLP